VYGPDGWTRRISATSAIAISRIEPYGTSPALMPCAWMP